MGKVVKKKSALREWVEAIVVAAALAVFLRTFFFQLYKIPTTSMVTTLMPGDKIFVIKFTYGPKIPFTNLRFPALVKLKRADVVVFIPPTEKDKPWFKRKQYVKRLIGMGGDHILIRDGNIYINGKMVVDPRIARIYYYNQGKYGRGNGEIVVPKGKYFFLGDNSLSSFDSRFWGFVDENDIIGKAIFIWWPPKRIGMIE
jgi:signal peptidase I